MEKPEYEYITHNPEVYTPDEEDAIEGLSAAGSAAIEEGDDELGDELWNDARGVSDAALIRGGATWENSTRTIKFEDGSSNVAAQPILVPTPKQIAEIHKEMEEEMKEDEEVQETEKKKEVPVMRASRKPIAPSMLVKSPGYVPTIMERIRGFFK